jgi:squalene cyclase
LDLELRKKLVKCYIWSIALYGAETWTLRAVDQEPLESFKMWCWRRMEKISWTDRVGNEEVLLRVKE